MYRTIHLTRKFAPKTFQTISRSTFIYNQNKIQKRFVHDVNISLKFNFSNVKDVIESLETKGAQLQSTKKATYQYFDVVPSEERVEGEKEKAPANANNYYLTTSDTWLRKEVNSGEWQCKAPHRQELTNQTHLNQKVNRIKKYELHNGEREIRRELNLQQDLAKPEEEIKTLEEDLIARDIHPFAKIDVEYHNFKVPEQDLEISLQVSEFGYNVGVVDSYIYNAKNEEIGEKQLDLQGFIGAIKDTSQPKGIREIVEEYIAKNKENSHFKALKEADIL